MGEIKLSCFSAVMPVIGWNQWVKWVAPFSIAHSFMALAITSAASGLRRFPSFLARRTWLNTSSGKRCCITVSLNTCIPNKSVMVLIAFLLIQELVLFYAPYRYLSRKYTSDSNICLLKSFSCAYKRFMVVYEKSGTIHDGEDSKGRG